MLSWQKVEFISAQLHRGLFTHHRLKGLKLHFLSSCALFCSLRRTPVGGTAGNDGGSRVHIYLITNTVHGVKIFHYLTDGTYV